MTTAARATRTPAVAAPAPARAAGPAKTAAKPWTMSGPPLVGASALQRGTRPGEVDLSAGTLDPTKVTPGAGGRAHARLGKLAAGEISLARTASGALRTTGRGSAIPLTLPGLGPALAGRTVLVVIVTDNVISGYAGLGSPGAFVARSDDALLGLALKDPTALGLAGMSRISPLSTINRLEQGTLNLGADIAFTLGGWLTGRGSLALAGEHLSAEGSAAITLPGGSGTLKVAAAAGKELSGDASLRLARGKLTGAADARLRGPTLDVIGTATYAGDRLRGSLTVAAIDADTARTIHRQSPIPELSIAAASPRPGPRAFCGVGDLEVSLTEWLIGRARVVVNSEGEATVQGEIAPPSEVVLFPQRDWVKRLGTFEARAPYGLPVIGNVFLFANISLEALATLGPGTLQDIKLSGQYSTDRSVGRELDLRATLRIPAFAGLRVRAEGGAGAEILAHDVKTGVSVWGLAGVRGYVEATPAITYRSRDGGPGEFVLAGHLGLAAQPFLALGGELFLAVESPALSPLPSERRTWPMSGIEVPLPGEFGIAADVAHVLGSKTCPEVQINEVAFDASNFMADLLREAPAGDKSKSQAKKPATWTEAAGPATPASASSKTAPATKPKTARPSATPTPADMHPRSLKKERPVQAPARRTRQRAAERYSAPSADAPREGAAEAVRVRDQSGSFAHQRHTLRLESREDGPIHVLMASGSFAAVEGQLRRITEECGPGLLTPGSKSREEFDGYIAEIRGAIVRMTDELKAARRRKERLVEELEQEALTSLWNMIRGLWTKMEAHLAATPIGPGMSVKKGDMIIVGDHASFVTEIKVMHEETARYGILARRTSTQPAGFFPYSEFGRGWRLPEAKPSPTSRPTRGRAPIINIVADWYVIMDKFPDNGTRTNDDEPPPPGASTHHCIRGHLIARMFGGDGSVKSGNIVAMTKKANTSKEGMSGVENPTRDHLKYADKAGSPVVVVYAVVCDKKVPPETIIVYSQEVWPGGVKYVLGEGPHVVKNT